MKPLCEAWPHAVIFDMDGLMYATEQQIRRAWDEVGPSVAGEPLGHNIYHTMGMNRALRVRYFRDTYGPDFPYEKFETAYKSLVSRMKKTEGIPVQKGLFELLAWLSEERIPCMLATGSSSFHTWENLDPYIYTLSCRMLGMRPEEVLVLEDSVNGVLAAYAAHTPVIMVPDLQKGQTDEVKGMPLAVMDSLLEVRDYLRSGYLRTE